MLKNYYKIDENSSVSSFLKEVNDKKNIHSIILDTDPKTIVDLRNISLKTHNPEEKLKNLKKTLSWVDAKEESEKFDFLMDSGERIIETPEGYYDFIDALSFIKKSNSELLKSSLQNEVRDEVFALNPYDKISIAKNFFTTKKVNILPVIENMKLLGEVRTQDFLVNNIFDQEALSTNVINIMNKKPLTLDYKESISKALELMINKKLPSIIVTKQDKLYSVISYSDIFRQYKKETAQTNYVLEIVGDSQLFEDEKSLIQKFAQKSMEKLSKMSSYNKLRLSLKTHGNTQGSHQTKASVNLNLSKGNKIQTVTKEITSGTSDEIYNNKIKGKWNIPQMVQDALKILEKKVISEKRRA